MAINGKRISYKLLAMLLSLCMILTMAPPTVWADGTGTEMATSVKVGHVNTDAVTLTSSGNVVYATTSSYGTITIKNNYQETDNWNLKFENGVLTLRDAVIKGTATNADANSASSNSPGGIKAETGNLKIILEGRNTITTGSSYDKPNVTGRYDCIGIDVTENLTISGNGSLYVNVGWASAEKVSVGIQAGSISVESGVITATTHETDSGMSCAINSTGAVNITGGTVTAAGGYAKTLGSGISSGINASSVNISGDSCVTAAGGRAGKNSFGINCSGNILVSGNATVTATGGDAIATGVEATDAGICCGISTTEGTISETAKVVAVGGNGTSKSYGIYSGINPLTYNGGLLVAKSGSSKDENGNMSATATNNSTALSVAAGGSAATSIISKNATGRTSSGVNEKYIVYDNSNTYQVVTDAVTNAIEDKENAQASLKWVDDKDETSSDDTTKKTLKLRNTIIIPTDKTGTDACNTIEIPKNGTMTCEGFNVVVGRNSEGVTNRVIYCNSSSIEDSTEINGTGKLLIAGGSSNRAGGSYSYGIYLGNGDLRLSCNIIAVAGGTGCVDVSYKSYGINAIYSPTATEIVDGTGVVVANTTTQVNLVSKQPVNNCSNSGAWDGHAVTWQRPSTVPQSDSTTVAKSEANQNSVSFDLTNAPEGAYKVYSKLSDKTPMTTVSATRSLTDGLKLTLTANDVTGEFFGENIPTGDYYISVTETSKPESARLKLTVTGDNTQSITPEAVNDAVAKSAEVCTSVEFDMTKAPNGTYKVYASAEKSDTTVLTTVSAVRVSSAKLKLSVNSGVDPKDIPTGDYYIAVTVASKPESERIKLTVNPYVAPSTTPATDTPTVARTEGNCPSVDFTMTTAPEGEYKVYNSNTATAPLTTVSAIRESNTKLKLSVNSEVEPKDIPTGEYYISVTEDGLAESARLKLTVTPYVAPPTPPSSSGSSDSQTPTITISGDSASAKVEVSTGSTTATVKEPTAANSEKIITNAEKADKPVIIDLSSLYDKLSEVVLPAKLLSEAANSEVKGLQVVMPDGWNIEFDKTALNVIAKSANSGTVKVSASTRTTASADEIAALGGKKPICIIDLKLTDSKGNAISSFNGGKAGITAKKVKLTKAPADLEMKHIEGGASTAVSFTAEETSTANTYNVKFDTKSWSAYALTEKDAEVAKPDETETVVLPFADVNVGRWSYDSIGFVYKNELFKGISDTVFGPTDVMNRGMLVTVLYRMDKAFYQDAAAGGDSTQNLTNNVGSDSTQSSVNDAGNSSTAAAGFVDVKAGAYYEDAVNWAFAKGLITGKDAAHFAPDEKVTREQIATILYRYAGDGESAELSGFDDISAVSDYAKTAMAWCVNRGSINGTATKLEPKSNATREQVAAMVQRFCRNRTV